MRPGFPERGGFADRFKEIERRLAALERAARLTQSSIGSGGLSIVDGGEVILEGGDLRIEGGDIVAEGQTLALRMRLPDDETASGWMEWDILDSPSSINLYGYDRQPGGSHQAELQIAVVGSGDSGIIRFRNESDDSSEPAALILTVNDGFILLDGGAIMIGGDGGNTLRFFNGSVTAPFPGATKQTVTGSRGGNAALQSLLDALEAYGLITDSSS